MRRSSFRLLLVALSLLIVAAIGFLLPPSSDAPPMSRDVAMDLLNRGKAALERRDIGAVMSMFTADARILGRSPAQMQPLIEEAMRDAGATPLTLKFDKLEVSGAQDGAMISVNLDIMQRIKQADASYYRPRVHLILRKERIPGFLGLSSHEEWLIRQLDADESLDLPSM